MNNRVFCFIIQKPHRNEPTQQNRERKLGMNDGFYVIETDRQTYYALISYAQHNRSKCFGRVKVTNFWCFNECDVWQTPGFGGFSFHSFIGNSVLRAVSSLVSSTHFHVNIRFEDGIFCARTPLFMITYGMSNWRIDELRMGGRLNKFKLPGDHQNHLR